MVAPAGEDGAGKVNKSFGKRLQCVAYGV